MATGEYALQFFEGTAITTTTAAADHGEVHFPFPVKLKAAYGIVTTAVAVGTGGSADAVLSIDHVDNDASDTRIELAAATLDAAVTKGNRICFTGLAERIVYAGESIVLEHKVASDRSGAGGVILPYVVWEPLFLHRDRGVTNTDIAA